MFSVLMSTNAVPGFSWLDDGRVVDDGTGRGLVDPGDRQLLTAGLHAHRADRDDLR